MGTTKYQMYIEYNSTHIHLPCLFEGLAEEPELQVHQTYRQVLFQQKFSIS